MAPVLVNSNSKERGAAGDAAAPRLRFLALVALVVVAAGLLGAPSASADLFFGEYGTGAGQMRQPEGLGVDRDGARVYVADRKNARIDVFSTSGEFIRAFGWGVAGGFGLQSCTSSCAAGVKGDGVGQFREPRAVAVDNAPGSPAYQHVYVLDTANYRVQEFTPAGEFVKMIGPGVNKTTGGDLCPEAPSDLCGAGVGDGSYPDASIKLWLTVGPTGTVYLIVSDPIEKVFIPENSGLGLLYETEAKLYDPSGSLLTTTPLFTDWRLVTAATVDSTENLFASIYDGVRKFNPSGELVTVFPGLESGFSLDQFGNLFSVRGAIEEVNALFEFGTAPQSLPGSVVTMADPSGAIVRRFGYEELATTLTRATAGFSSLDGNVFVAEGAQAFDEEHSLGNRIAYLGLPPAGPIAPGSCVAKPLGNTKATLNGYFNPEGKPTTFHFDYVDAATFEAQGWAGADSTAESAPSEADFSLKAATAVPSLVPSTAYRCRLVVTNSDGTATTDEGEFETLPPFEVTATWASEVLTDTAEINAEVNPFGIPATGYFEYVDDATYQASGFDEASRAPAGSEPELDFGGGESPVAEGVKLTGLLADTTYRYRIVVTDSFFPQGLPSPERQFRTFGASTDPDGRAYEQVSPALKNNANVAVPNTSGGLDSDAFRRLQASALDGESATFTSFTSFGEPAGAQGTSQYLARRGSTGWNTENLTPAGFIVETLRPPFKGFSPDLRFSGAVTTEPPLTPDALDGYENLYLRDNATGQFTALTSEEPLMDPEEDPFCPVYYGSSQDGSRAFFGANGAFAGAKEGRGFSLYEWSAAEGVRLVSRLPNGNSATPAGGNTVGSASTVGSGCNVQGKTLRHAISADGGRVFWTYQPPTGPTRLMARIDGAETVQIDATQGGGGPDGGGRFLTASADGSIVLFDSSNELTSDAAGDGNLYRYDFGAPSGERLTNLTAADPGGGQVLGILGASEDASAVYFAANGTLAPGATDGGCNGTGPSASGECSLYVWREGEGVRLVERVSGKDYSGWIDNPFEQTARVSSSGRYLAFASIRSLTGYDNLMAEALGCEEGVEEELGGDPRCAQAFVYDAETEDLVCASCARSGARPTAPAGLPVWSNPIEPPHNLSDDGTRLFFSTHAALVPEDDNDARDVYEFERAGAGSCDSSNPNYVEASDGCLFLVSGGEGSQNSYLIGASASGRDVFFSTVDRLVGWDRDDHYDVYDYRAGGGFPEPVPPQSCAALSECRPLPAVPPAVVPPSTEQTVDPGNVRSKAKEKRCPKGKRKVRRHGKPRCVRKAHKKHHKRKGHRRGRSGR